MSKKLMAAVAMTLILTLLSGVALAASGDLTIKETVAYADAAMTKPVAKIPAGTSLLVRAYERYADVYYGGKIVYVSNSDLMKKDASTDYYATLKKGTRVYQRADSDAKSFKLKRSGTVSLCLVAGEWALVRTTGKLGLYAFVKLDKLTDLRTKK